MTGDEFYLDELLGRMLLARNNRPVGRIEEFQAEQRGDHFHIVQFLIGSAGLMSRLDVGVKALFGKGGGGKIVQWDQVDISDPVHPRLTCSVEELKPITSA
jgi:hypothetical protein